MINVVTLEGLDYSGKTTTLIDLAEKNRKNGKLYFNEGVIYPTGLTARLFSICNQSTDIEKEFLYTTIMMMDKIEAKIRHSDDRRVLIQDRYWPSVVSYGRFLNGKSSMHRYQDYSSLFLQPQATILLSCSNDEILKRSERRCRKSVVDNLLLSNPKEVERLKSEIERSVKDLPHILRINTTDKPIENVGKEIMVHLKNLGLVS